MPSSQEAGGASLAGEKDDKLQGENPDEPEKHERKIAKAKRRVINAKIMNAQELAQSLAQNMPTATDQQIPDSFTCVHCGTNIPPRRARGMQLCKEIELLLGAGGRPPRPLPFLPQRRLQVLIHLDEQEQAFEDKEKREKDEKKKNNVDEKNDDDDGNSSDGEDEDEDGDNDNGKEKDNNEENDKAKKD
ncbi:hypothetical protein HD806DRAFT_524286 [Xylariaceae sp. AK1471]|nr:hypothetical protein HD806DRAFT_524286 [Xylariaceae sp. AK1471]